VSGYIGFRFGLQAGDQALAVRLDRLRPIHQPTIPIPGRSAVPDAAESRKRRPDPAATSTDAAFRPGSPEPCALRARPDLPAPELHAPIQPGGTVRPAARMVTHPLLLRFRLHAPHTIVPVAVVCRS
jgi:hypothetical protein